MKKLPSVGPARLAAADDEQEAAPRCGKTRHYRPRPQARAFDGIRFAVKCYSVAVAMVLHDKLGFGEVRLNRTMGQIQDMFDSIQRDYVKIGDLERALLEECGISFKDGDD